MAATDKDGCNPWIFKPDGSITEIRISSGACVDSIRFTYIDQDHVKHHSETYGGDGGERHTISFADHVENLIEISGTVGVFEGIKVITSMTFMTNKTTYGPYGTNGGTSFSWPLTKDKFLGFYGTYGDYLDSIGVILHPYYSG